ncbi:ABC-three component system protein [Nocardia elegans]|uniref:ABC-three component system protein n=1 Tax=Nocardia elegans TaxID=300029 RepID=A0ABW6TMY7_9NOCA
MSFGMLEVSVTGSTAVLADVPVPSPVIAGVSFGGPPISPMGRISLYTADDWEEFVREWVQGLKASYVQIKRFGGAGDRGADIAAFKTVAGMEGPWDCFQCKHYDRSLGFAAAWPEILKVFVSVLDGRYTMPDTYHFAAPKGCSTQFNVQLSQPTKLKQDFLDKLKDPKVAKKVGKEVLSAARLADVENLARVTDFSLFRSVELAEMLDVHRETCWYAYRFATMPAPRPGPEPVPPALSDHETRYIEQLLAVYAERHPELGLQTDSVSSDATVGAHFRRQRERFYRAEQLRVYARDAVPPGTFDQLQNEIHEGVIDTAEADHENGFQRLNKVLDLVGTLDLNRHTLISVAGIEDRKGICHQLANDDRLTWVPQS